MSKKRVKSFLWILLVLLLIPLILGGIFVLIDNISNGMMIDFVIPWFADTLRYWLIYRKGEVFFVFISIIWTFAGIFMWIGWLIAKRKYQESLQILIDSIDLVFDKQEGKIFLPEKSLELEQKLNQVKYMILHNEQMAKEAEQKKNDLVVYLAHDLKTPLTSVIGYLTLLHDEKQISEELQRKYLKISLTKAQRLEELINEFFEITRFNLQNVHLEKTGFSLSTMLLQLSEEFYPVLSEKNIECNVSIQEDLVLYADADKIARVFDNLLKNAVAYSDQDSVIQIRAIEQGETMIIGFQNQGKTIPEHQIKHIFEKFYRLDSSRSSKTGGAGLGLAISKEIIELHGGTIQVTSKNSVTEFIVRIPKK